MKYKVDKTTRIIGSVFLFLGIGMLVGSFFLAKNSLEYYKNGAPAEGYVTENIRRSSDDGYTYYPMVQFYANGEMIEFKHSIGTGSPSFSVGEKVDILYLEDNPNDAKIDTFFSLWGSALIVSVFGLVFGSVGAGVVLSAGLSRKSHAKLLASGTRIYTKFECVDFFEREKSEDYWTIKTSWHNPRDNKMYIFHSEALWYNLEDHMTGREILVYINKDNPKKYVMDTSFLPEAA